MHRELRLRRRRDHRPGLGPRRRRGHGDLRRPRGGRAVLVRAHRHAPPPRVLGVRRDRGPAQGAEAEQGGRRPRPAGASDDLVGGRERELVVEVERVRAVGCDLDARLAANALELARARAGRDRPPRPHAVGGHRAGVQEREGPGLPLQRAPDGLERDVARAVGLPADREHLDVAGRLEVAVEGLVDPRPRVGDAVDRRVGIVGLEDVERERCGRGGHVPTTAPARR